MNTATDRREIDDSLELAEIGLAGTRQLYDWRRREMFDADTLHVVLAPLSNLLARIPHGSGQTVMREALVLADHNAYHLGQLFFLKKLLEQG